MFDRSRVSAGTETEPEWLLIAKLVGGDEIGGRVAAEIKALDLGGKVREPLLLSASSLPLALKTPVAVDVSVIEVSWLRAARGEIVQQGKHLFALALRPVCRAIGRSLASL